ncbi:MAG: SRPBCC domain-containing protein [Myxococcota bacterium]
MKPVVVRTRVPAGVAETFRLFTEEVDAWWKRGPRFRFGPDGREGILAFEGRVGGRFVERFPEGDALSVGEVLAWEPPSGFAFRLHPSAPGGGPGTRVEVAFRAIDAATTEVTLTHSGLETVPAGGRTGALRSTALRNVLSVWWADLLSGLRRA